MYSIEACRICLQTKSEQHLKRTSSVSENDISFFEQLAYCVNEVHWSSYGFPSLLCNDCIKDLQTAYKFKLLCIQSDVHRQKYIEEHAWKSNLNAAVLFNSDRVEVVEEETTVGIEDSETNDKAEEEMVVGTDDSETNDNCYSETTATVLVGSNEVKSVVDAEERIVGIEYFETNDNYDIEEKIEVHEMELTYNETNEHVKEENPTQKKRKPGLPSYIDIYKRFCTLCNRTFTRYDSLANHVRNVHSLEKKYRCDFCPEAFCNNHHLRKHRAQHTSEGNCVCYLCGKTYLTPSELKPHIEQHENKRQYECDLCGKRFNILPSLKSHKRVVHSDPQQWKYLCTQCGKRCVTQALLDTHMKRHLNLKNFSCHFCEKRFVTKSEIMRHLLRHTDVRRFKCEVCGAEYKEKVLLTRHLKLKHDIGDVVVKERVKKHACEECPKKFMSKKELEKHKETHARFKPLKCSVCNKGLTSEHSVKSHMRTQHGISGVKLEELCLYV